MKRRNQNQKISFPFFAGSPHTPRRRRKSKEIFGFVIATEGSVRGAYSLHHAIGAYDLGQSHHALRACEVNQNPADFVRNTFELRPIHTASTVISLIYGQGLVFIILAGHKLGNPRLYETAIKAYKKRNFRELTCFHSYFTRNPPTADNQKSAAPAAPQLPFPP